MGLFKAIKSIFQKPELDKDRVLEALALADKLNAKDQKKVKGILSKYQKDIREEQVKIAEAEGRIKELHGNVVRIHDLLLVKMNEDLEIDLHKELAQ